MYVNWIIGGVELVSWPRLKFIPQLSNDRCHIWLNFLFVCFRPVLLRLRIQNCKRGLETLSLYQALAESEDGCQCVNKVAPWSLGPLYLTTHQSPQLQGLLHLGSTWCMWSPYASPVILDLHPFHASSAVALHNHELIQRLTQQNSSYMFYSREIFFEKMSTKASMTRKLLYLNLAMLKSKS